MADAVTTPPPRDPDPDPAGRTDPRPDTTTGLEPGGGVPPGETPPGEASVSAVHVDPGPGARTRSPWLVILLIALPVLLISLFLIARVF